MPKGDVRSGRQPKHFRRTRSSPPENYDRPSQHSSVKKVETLGDLPKLEIDSDDELDSDDSLPPLPKPRSVTEPAPVTNVQRFFEGLDAVDSSLPFTKRQVVTVNLPLLLNAMLCVVSLFSSCLMPVLVDLSRTATVFGQGGAEVRRKQPYSALSVITAEAAFNVAIGVVAIATKRPPGGFTVLYDVDLHRAMLPLTLVYCVGDLAALFAIGSGGGVLYMAVTNSRLLFAAAASQLLLGIYQSRRQWLLLAEITAATAVYAAISALDAQRSSSSSGTTNISGISIGICWALIKSGFSGLAAVLTEKRYKKLNLWHANTLLKTQSLLVAGAAMLLNRLFAEDIELCDPFNTTSAVECVDRKGWDGLTWAVLAGEVGTGWLSVAILTRMSAIAKFICKAATAPTLYLAYSCTQFRGSQFHAGSFSAVLCIAVGIMAYVAEPYLFKKPVDDEAWISQYSRGSASAQPASRLK